MSEQEVKPKQEVVKPKQEKKKKAPKAPKPSKKANKEGSKIAAAIKGQKAEFYIADVQLEDSEVDVLGAVKNAIRTMGKFHSTFMVISAGVKVIIVAVHVADESKERIDGKGFLAAGVFGLKGEANIVDDVEGTDFHVTIAMETPFKFKDTVRANGFAYLKKNGLIVEDEESSEEYNFDDISE